MIEKGFLSNAREKTVPEKTLLDRVSIRFLTMALVVCMGLAGIDQGILILMDRLQVPAIVQAHIGFLYWVAAAGILTLVLRRQVRKHYEDPARRISEAATKIAKGDFSVRIPLVHESTEERDFFDDTIEDINTMTEELGTIETLKTDFVSNVSHEMKTPLAVIRNYTELLEKKPLDEESREYLSVISETAAKMTGLITDILRLNRIENQKIVPGESDTDVVRCLSDCLLQFENVWEKKNIEIDMDAEDSRIIRTDEGLLQHVFMNLLSNAFKFTDEGGNVSVREYVRDEKVFIEISDSGCGMDENTATRIFERFYQGDSSRSTEGNGLGLALVDRILKLLGGEISVESALGKGSTFTVRLKT